MAAPPVKPPLHNFPLAFLKWGTKNHPTNAATTHRHRRPSSAEPVTEPDYESDRPHRVGSSRAARHRLSLIPCSDTAKRHRSEERESEERESSDHEAEVGALQKPWNLRPRRAPATAAFQKANTLSVAVASGGVGEPEGANRSQSEQPKSMRLRGLAAEGQSVERKEKRKFWIALSKEEIEEDVFIMTGSRPSRRPKKRPRNVQKQLDAVFPGLWLVGVTADAYKAADSPSKR